jgi:Cu(I)/Ag(I) efflux system membrane fusion protein
MSRFAFSGLRRLSLCSLPSFVLPAFLLLVFCALAAGAARVGHAAPQAEPAAAASSPAKAGAYVCPMHPQIRGDAGDSCPICGMRLVQRAPADADASRMTTPAVAEAAPTDLHHGHDHGPDQEHADATTSAPALPAATAAPALPGTAAADTQADTRADTGGYVCPMHPQIRGDAGDSCPICGMRLVQRAPADAGASRMTTPAVAEAAPTDLHHGHDHGPDREHADVTTSAPALPAATAAPALPGTAGADTRADTGAYVCPMHPQIRGDAGDSCPICGMALVRREASSDAMSQSGTSVEAPGLAISAVALQRLGVRTGVVERRQLKPVQRAPGRVLALPAGQRRVQARVEGWLERLHVRAIGEQVRAGQVLAEIYSPEIERIRPEFALGEAAAAGAAARLRRLGLAAADIERIREGGRARIPLRAPVSGVIRAIEVREGARVSAESVLFDIDGLDGRWIEARLPLAQAIALGEVASARLRLPGSAETIELEGAWERLPQVDPLTQTQALRLAVDAEQVALPLEAYVELELTGTPRPAQLLIPRSAVIRTAEGARVVQRAANGELRPRAVSLGAFAGDQVEVVSGLDEGDAIVVSGQFLLDAEADLTGALQRMFGSDTVPSATGHAHEH